MKTSRTFLLLLVTASGAVGGDDPVPTALPKERYGTMSARSPFALTTAAAPVQTQGSFAANWFVSGIARLNDEDFVSIKARDLSAQFSLFGRETHPQNGVALASVNWSDAIGKSTVILRRGTETAKLEFNEAELRQPATTAAPKGARPTGAGAVSGENPAPGPINANGTPVPGANPPAIRRRIVRIPAP